MRIVTFPVLNGVPDYALYGGVEDFGETNIIGASCVGEYFGPLDAATLPDYIDPTPTIPVSVISITGPAVLTTGVNSAIVKQEADLVIVVSVPLPDNTVALIPLLRTDTGRLVKAFGTVINGEVTLNIQIPTAGDWISNSELINTETTTGFTFDFPGLLLNCVLNR